MSSKRLLLFTLYVGLLYFTADRTESLLMQNGVETTRNGLAFWAVVVVVLRLVYGLQASRTRFSESQSDGTDSDADSGSLARLKSAVSGEQTAVTLSPPAVPEQAPLETVEPSRRSVLAAGVVNAITTGGVVDGEFSTRGIKVRIGLLLLLVPAAIDLADGAMVFFLTVAGGVFGLLGVLSAVSAAHMRLALGDVEYRFYDSVVVAYDRRLGEPQWKVPYDSIGDVTVKRGLFGSPLWVDTGTVSFERTDSPQEDELEYQEPRSSIAFVPNADRVSRLIQSRDRQRRAGVRGA